jgi:hypothetical protein
VQFSTATNVQFSPAVDSLGFAVYLVRYLMRMFFVFFHLSFPSRLLADYGCLLKLCRWTTVILACMSCGS